MLRITFVQFYVKITFYSIIKKVLYSIIKKHHQVVK